LHKEKSVTDDWAERRRAELEASAPVKRKKTKPFVAKIELDTAAKAFTATGCQKGFVWLWFLHQVWKTGSKTIAVPNGALLKYGVSRKIKCSALRQLEVAGLIAMERRSRKTPLVTVLV
jgi:hypothetical protein